MDDEKRDSLLLEILDRMARIETKLDAHTETRQTAETALAIAREALQIGHDNSKDVDGIKKTAQWAIGLLATGLVGIGGVLLTILLT